MALFRKKQKQAEGFDTLGNEMAKPADDLDHLDEDGELPWGWVTHNSDFTQKIGKEFNYFRENWVSARNSGDTRSEHDSLKSLLLYIDDVQKLCDQKGECFGFWCREYLLNEEWKKKLQARLAELEK